MQLGLTKTLMAGDAAVDDVVCRLADLARSARGDGAGRREGCMATRGGGGGGAREGGGAEGRRRVWVGGRESN